MFDISNNGIITITRGDTAVTDLIINIGTNAEPIIFDLTGPITSGDGSPTDEQLSAGIAKVYFGLMEPNQPFERALLKKVFDYRDFDMESHTLRISFKSEDTHRLLPGTYYYSIKLHRPKVGEFEERVDTLIGKKKFVIID